MSLPFESAALPPLIAARGLRKSYNGAEVVRGVDLDVFPGEIVGFLGPNGAGKTTTVGMLHGAVIPGTGEIRAENLTLPRDAREARRTMGIVTQEDNLDPDFNTEENLLQFAHHYGIRGVAARNRADELLHLVGLDSHRRHRIDELSGGLKRRLVLARALLNRPRLVFLDEPTTGLDPDSRQEFWRLVSGLRQDGCGIVLTTHYMDEAQRLCDRLFLMQSGQIIDQGTPDELIARTVGREVIEVDSVPQQLVADLAARLNTWWRPHATGCMIALPDGPHDCLSQLEQAGATRLTIRQANLEDVFMRLTGERLGT